jgi:hypothetical protein
MKIHLAYGLLSALTLVGISPQYAVAQDDYSDPRIAIDLTQAEQAHVRSRMLDLLSGVQAMTEAAANDDLDWFREVADQLSTPVTILQHGPCKLICQMGSGRSAGLSIAISLLCQSSPTRPLWELLWTSWP